MSTGTSARRVRSALAVHSVLVGFAAIYLSIIVLSFAAVRAFEPRLPVEARNLASYWLESEFIAIAMYLAWIALPRPHRMRYALETLLPIGLVVLGVDAAGLTATLWFNLDETAFPMPFGSLPGLGLMALGAVRRLARGAQSRRSRGLEPAAQGSCLQPTLGVVCGDVPGRILAPGHGHHHRTHDAPADPPGAGDVVGLRPRLAPAVTAAGRRGLGIRDRSSATTPRSRSPTLRSG